MCIRDRGYERKLNLVGVGYKAEVKNKQLHLALGFSHPVVYEYESEIDITTPSPTEIIVKGINKQRVAKYLQRSELLGHQSHIKGRV